MNTPPSSSIILHPSEFPTILFLCTGNYYRSRFAEHLFNHLARQTSLPFQAQSRGLSTATGDWKTGPMSHHTIAALHQRSIPLPSSIREPLYCTDDDLTRAHLVIALKEAEHRPILEKCFPSHCPSIEFWHIHDIDQAHPDHALAEIESLVRNLLTRLTQGTPASTQP